MSAVISCMRPNIKRICGSSVLSLSDGRAIFALKAGIRTYEMIRPMKRAFITEPVSMPAYEGSDEGPLMKCSLRLKNQTHTASIQLPAIITGTMRGIP